MRESDPALVEHAILMRMLADQEAGKAGDAEHYRKLFPGHEAMVDCAARELRPGGQPGSERQLFGPFEVISTLGRGGQGVVYLARDTELPRTVALKVLTVQGAFDTHRQIRFRREAEIAAKLDHPGLCRVLAFGLQGDAPYLAMQFVPGEPLSSLLVNASEGEAVKLMSSVGGDPLTSPDSRADVRRVLQLVERLARSLHVAHESAVVHRDIKPANVMITPAGDPVLLDFGLARDDDSTVDTLTATSDVLGTPAYMSPEQIEGKASDRRTDVFSLGVLLYECLVGVRPFVGVTRRQLFDATVRAEFEPATRRNASVPADLDVVLSVALERDPQRRYDSAEMFAEDLGRVLRREPVLARPVDKLTRVRHWLQRNRTVAFSGLLVLTMAIAATTVSTLAWLRSEHARESTQAINDYILKDLLVGASPDGLGREARIVDALQFAANRIDERFQDRPELAAEIRLHLARTFGRLGAWEEAQLLAEQAWQHRRSVFGDNDKRTIEADLEASTARLRREGSSARERLQATFDRIVAVHGAESELAVRCASDLARATFLAGDREVGLREAADVYQLAERLFGKYSPTTMGAASQLFTIQSDMYRNEEALQLMREIVARAEVAHGKRSSDVLEATMDLGQALLASGLDLEAAEVLQGLVKQMREVFGERHPYVAFAVGHLGAAYLSLGQFDDAIACKRQSHEGLLKALGLEHRLTLIALRDLAITYRTARKNDEAMSHAKQALKIAEDAFGERSEQAAICHDVVAAIYLNLADAEAAVTSAQRAYDISREVWGDEDPRLADLLFNLAAAFDKGKKFEQAVPIWRRIVEMDTANNGANSPWVAQDLRRLAVTLYLSRQYSAAAVEMQLALDRLLALSDQEVSKLACRRARARAYLALMRYHQKDKAGVLETLEKSWAVLEAANVLSWMRKSDIVPVMLELYRQNGDTANVARLEKMINGGK